MEIINPRSIKKIADARKVIFDLQEKVIQLEQVLDDLARAVEIATVSGQFHITESFRMTAIEMLEDRIVDSTVDSHDNEDLKVRIYE